MTNNTNKIVDRQIIGFKLYDDGNDSSSALSINNTQNQEENTKPIENIYFDTVVRVLQEFLKEEINGYAYTEKRLISKIESARNLFGKEREQLGKTHNILLDIL